MHSDGPGKSVKVVRRTLADGTVREYRYEIKPRLSGPAPQPRAIVALADAYCRSPDFAKLSPGWQAATRKYIKILDEELGWMSLAQLNDRKARAEFYRLRDDHASTPAKADKISAVLRTIIGWAYKRNMIDYNHALGIERLVPSTHSRAQHTWSADQIRAFLAHARPDVGEAFNLALWTLAREVDLISLKWEQFDGRWLVYTPSKTAGKVGTVVHLPVYALPPMAKMLGSLSRCSDYILTQRQGHPWSASNLSRQFEVAREAAGLAGADLTWHDLRGTGITRLYLAGCTDPEVASISGHVMGDRAQQRAYIARARDLALHAFEKLAGYLPTLPPKAHQRRNYGLGKDKK